MEAGRALDLTVAVKVMGWKAVVQPHPELPPVSLNDLYDNPAIPMPRYSTDIADAWLVVEKLRARTPLTVFNLTTLERQYSAAFYTYRNGSKADCDYSHADTASHAICLAALRAAGAA